MLNEEACPICGYLPCQCLEGTITEKRDGKGAKSKGYSLRDWFKGGGWVQAGGKYDGKPCAKQPGQKTKPFCRDADDRAAMSKDERERRAKKKRREDPNPNRKGKAKMVSASYSNWRSEIDYLLEKKKDERIANVMGGPTLPGEKGRKAYPPGKAPKPTGAQLPVLKAGVEPEGDLVDEGKKDACYHKVKRTAKVWPSAYASGRLVQCRKKGAANWGNSKKTRKEAFEFSNWRDDFKATEYEFIDIIKPAPMKGLAEAKTKDHEHQMARSEISKIVSAAGRLKKKVKGEGNLKAWVQSKITRAADYIDTAADYMDGNEGSDTHESVNEKCWDGYVKKGMKKKGKRMVPNCVKEFSDWRSEIDEGAAWTRKEGKNKSGGLNEKGRKSYERENPGSDLKAPSKKKGNKRRKSFCARMRGMKAKLTSKKTARDPDSRINKSLRAWNC